LPHTEQSSETASRVAERFVRARQNATALPEFPGEIPASMDEGYAIQEAAIGLWPDEIAGWKIGGIAPALHEKLGQKRLAGPVFSRSVVHVDGGGAELAYPSFEGGCACFEAEFVLRIGTDADPGKLEWTPEEAASLVGALHIGVEMAGSPLPTINALGPTVVASDFGNNAGLIVGPEILNFREVGEGPADVKVTIDNEPIGEKHVPRILEAPLAALAFLAAHCAKRGRPLTAGLFITTGAITGVHDVPQGHHSLADFGAFGKIRIKGVKASPS
jgi:2-keto-4-pentenoate hydratase